MAGYIALTIPTTSQLQKDLLVALLSDIGFEGFEEERNLLKGFIAEEIFDEYTCRSLLQAQAAEYSTSVIPERNWNEEWESGFQPVVVDEFCIIRADFHQPSGSYPYEIIITPKMSFGTGHHATTSMMISMMKELPFAGKSALDFGTGTGVLAILAEKLGAASIKAIDNDDWSIANAQENLLRNGCDKVRVEKADSIANADRFDFILANINRHVILNQMEQMSAALNHGGSLLISGILEDDLEIIEKKLNDYSLSVLNKIEKHNWICVRCVNSPR